MVCTRLNTAGKLNRVEARGGLSSPPQVGFADVAWPSVADVLTVVVRRSDTSYVSARIERIEARLGYV